MPMPSSGGVPAEMAGAHGHDGVRRRQHRDRAEPVRQPAADRPHHDGDQDEARHPVGGVGGRQPVGRLEVGGEVDRERDVAAEGDGVEDARLPRDGQPGVGVEPAGEAGGRHHPPRGVAQQEPGDDRVDGEDGRGDEERCLLTHVGEELDRGEGTDRRATHACAEDADRQSAPLRREPRVDERDAHREDGARDAEEEAADEEEGVGVERDERDEEDRHDGGRGDHREHHATAVAVRHRPDHDPAERADQHRHSHQQGDVRLAQVAERPGVAEHRAERADERPRPEVHGEPERGEGQHQDRRPGPGARDVGGRAPDAWPGGRVVRHSDDSVRPGLGAGRAKGPGAGGLRARRVSRLPGPQRVRMCAGPAPYEVAGPNTFLARGNVPVVISDLVLGTMYFGTRTDRDTSFALLDRFVEAGGRWIDTANCYAFWADESGHGGQSEAMLGDWLRANPGVRQRVGIATKVGVEPDDSGHAEGLSADAVRRGAEASLARLGVDRVDLFWAHARDLATPIEETAEAMGALVTDGRAARLGLSNHPTWLVERARAHARPGGSSPSPHSSSPRPTSSPDPARPSRARTTASAGSPRRPATTSSSTPRSRSGPTARSSRAPSTGRTGRSPTPTSTPARRPGWRPSPAWPDGSGSPPASSCSPGWCAGASRRSSA